jgi:hypothetical protein
MSFRRVAVLLIIIGSIALAAVAKSGTPQNSTAKRAEPEDVPKSIAESVSATLQFTEGNFLALAEAMPEDFHPYGWQVR